MWLRICESQRGRGIGSRACSYIAFNYIFTFRVAYLKNRVTQPICFNVGVACISFF